MIVYTNVEHLDIAFLYIYKVFNKNERLNVNVWVAKEALTLISQRLGNFRLNGCLIKLCWRENNPCLPGALRKEKEKKERNEKDAQGCSPMWTPPKFNLVAQSLPRTAPDLLTQSRAAGAGVWRLDLHFGDWEEVISSVTCVFTEDAHAPSWRGSI